MHTKKASTKSGQCLHKILNNSILYSYYFILLYPAPLMHLNNQKTGLLCHGFSKSSVSPVCRRLLITFYNLLALDVKDRHPEPCKRRRWSWKSLK